MAPAAVNGVTDTGPLHVAGGEPVMLVQLCTVGAGAGIITSDRANTAAETTIDFAKLIAAEPLGPNRPNSASLELSAGAAP